MTYKKLGILLAVCVFHSAIVAAQVTHTYMTLTPSSYPDTVNKPAIVTDASGRSNTAPVNNSIKEESKTMMRQETRSIGKASIVIPTEKSAPASAAAPVEMNIRLERKDEPLNNSTPK